MKFWRIFRIVLIGLVCFALIGTMSGVFKRDKDTDKDKDKEEQTTEAPAADPFSEYSFVPVYCEDIDSHSYMFTGFPTGLCRITVSGAAVGDVFSVSRYQNDPVTFEMKGPDEQVFYFRIGNLPDDVTANELTEIEESAVFSMKPSDYSLVKIEFAPTKDYVDMKVDSFGNLEAGLLTYDVLQEGTYMILYCMSEDTSVSGFDFIVDGTTQDELSCSPGMNSYEFEAAAYACIAFEELGSDNVTGIINYWIFFNSAS